MDIQPQPSAQDQKTQQFFVAGLIITTILLGLWWWRRSAATMQTGPATNQVAQTSPNDTLDPSVWAEPDGKDGADYELNSNERAVTRTVYRNETLGFTLTLPAGWYLPPVTDNDPHFYSCPSYDCDMAVEIQASVETATQGYEGTWKYAADFELNPRRLDTLIPGARVIASEPEGGAEGWQKQYWVFFSNPSRAYVIFANGTTTERNILSTFRVIK